MHGNELVYIEQKLIKLLPEYIIYYNGSPAAQVSKKWFVFRDTYGVDVSDDKDCAFILALVIVIDQVVHYSNHNNS